MVLSMVFMSFYLATILVGSAWLVRRASLRKIWESVSAFDELAQAGFHGGAHEEVAENFDFASEIVVGDRFDEFFGGDGGPAIEFFQLRGGGAGHAEGVAFGHYLADEADALRFGGVNAAAG